MIAVSANLRSGSYIHQQERPVFLVNNWKPNDLPQWNFKYQLALLKYGSVSAAQHLHKTQFSISTMTSCVLKHADPDVINSFHKPFYLLAMNSVMILPVSYSTSASLILLRMDLTSELALLWAECQTRWPPEVSSKPSFNMILWGKW